MPQFRIHRLKDQPRGSFRSAPHISAPATVKAKDYEAAGEIEARHEYDAWSQLHQTASPLRIGDLLETESGELRICKYVGFEAASWLIPETAAASPTQTPPAESEAN